MGGLLPHFWMREFFSYFSLISIKILWNMLWNISFRTFGEKKSEKKLFEVTSRDLQKCGSWPPIVLSPSFQIWNYKNSTFSDPNAVKIVKIV